MLSKAEGNIAGGVMRESLVDPARSENLSMYGIFMRENREIPRSPEVIMVQCCCFPFRSVGRHWVSDEAVKGGGNSARWCNKQFDDLVTKAAQLPKREERAKLYEQAQVIFKEEAPWITIAHSVRFDPIRKEVKGYKMDATAHHFFDKAEVGNGTTANMASR